MVVSTNTLIVSLPTDKIRQIRSEATRIFNMASLSARLLSQFLGKLNAATQAVAPAPLFFRYLQQDLQSALAHGNKDYETLLSLSCQAKEVAGASLQVEWQATQTENRPDGHPIGCLPVRLGSTMQRNMHGRCLVSSGADNPYQLPRIPGSNTGSEDIHEDISGTSVLLQLDNATAVAYINNLGGTVLSQLMELVKEIWQWALNKDIFLKAQHIPGVSNTVADAESRTL